MDKLTTQPAHYCLTVACPDRIGVVAAVSQLIAEHHGWLIESDYHTDTTSGWFFMRNVIKADSLATDCTVFKAKLATLADQWQMRWHLQHSDERKKVVILASRASHCLADLLHRWHSQELHCDIPCVIANHKALQEMVEWYDIPFHYVPITSATRDDAFAQIEQLAEQYQADSLVLARYMQIIPPALCAKYAGQIINIHHSFLPSFVGGKPYQQAADRGVKLIGATSHYVTEDLDEGPIIEQDVLRVSHRYDTADLMRMGKDVEKSVLARAVRLHLENRVFVMDNRTVIFN